MAEQIPLEDERVERVDWLVRLRWLAVLGLGIALVLGWLWYPDELPLLPLAAVILGIVLYNAQFSFYARTLRLGQAEPDRLQRATQFTQVQVALDLVALAALLHFSGGAESPLAILFVLPTAVAGTLLSRRATFLTATLAVLLLAAVAGLEGAGFLAHYHPPVLEGIELRGNVPYVVTVTGTLAVCLWFLAYLCSSVHVGLGERERQVMRNLQASLDDCRELETVNERLRRLDAERTRFLMLVTHELRAPINTIHMCVEVALSDYASPEKVREILERVERRTAGLSDLIGDLLRLARAREGAVLDEGIGLVQPEKVLRSVVQLMKAKAEAKDLFLSVDIAPDLAPVRANPERLKLVWTNLLSNAIKYTEPGGIVAVGLRQMPEHLVGTVRDTGIGIPPEDLQRVFEEFYRSENAREVSSVGTGVGLSIVQRIVKNWGGRVWVESELGLGSKFTFVLPRADVQEVKRETTSVERDA